MIINPTNIVERNGEVVAVEFATATGTMKVVKRIRPNWWSASVYEKNDFLARPRVFVDTNADESLLENIENRTRRPMKVWRKAAMDILNAWNLPFGNFELKWSQNAGCRMCPCSPGFIMQIEGYRKGWVDSITLAFTLPDGREVRFDRYDIWVSADVESVDETRPARQVAVLV